MKKLMLIGMLLLVGCGEAAVVISSDGTTEVAYCPGDVVPTCVMKACPNGYYTLKGADSIRGDCVVRCIDKPTDAK